MKKYLYSFLIIANLGLSANPLSYGWKTFFDKGMPLPEGFFKDYEENKTKKIIFQIFRNFTDKEIDSILKETTENQEIIYNQFKSNKNLIERINKSIESCADIGLENFASIFNDYGFINMACYKRYRMEQMGEVAGAIKYHPKIGFFTNALEKYKLVFDKLKDHPRKSMGAIAGLMGAALICKKRAKIKKYFGKKINSFKEAYRNTKERYQDLREMDKEDIKSLAKMELEDRWGDFKSSYLNKKFLAKASGIGLAGVTAIGLQKKFGFLQKVAKSSKSGLSWLDKNSVKYFTKACDLGKANPAVILPVGSALTIGTLFNFFKAKSSKQNIQDFMAGLNNSQLQKLKDPKFMTLLCNAYDNPEVLMQNKDFKEILTTKQIDKLNKIVDQYKKNRSLIIR